MRDQPSNLGTPLSYSEHTVTEEARSLQEEGKMYNPTDPADSQTSERKNLNTPGSPLIRQNTVDGKKQGPKGPSDADAGSAPSAKVKGGVEGQPDTSYEGAVDVKWPFTVNVRGSKKRVSEALKAQSKGRDQLHSGKKGHKTVKHILELAASMVEEVPMEDNEAVHLVLDVNMTRERGNNDVVIRMDTYQVDLPTHLGHKFESLEEFEEWQDGLKDRDDMANRREQAPFREARGETLTPAERGEVSTKKEAPKARA